MTFLIIILFRTDSLRSTVMRSLRYARNPSSRKFETISQLSTPSKMTKNGQYPSDLRHSKYANKAEPLYNETSTVNLWTYKECYLTMFFARDELVCC